MDQDGRRRPLLANNTLTPDLQEVAQERGRLARHLWLALENQFLDNRKTRTLHLDAVFRNFVQNDISVTEYCHKFKGMDDALADLGSPVDDRILVLNILRGLNQRFEHLDAIIRRSSPFPSFLKVRDDLLLEEIHLDTAGPSTAPTTLYTSTAPLAPKPTASTPTRPPNNNNRNKNNNHRNCGNGGSNSNKTDSSGGDCGGKSGNTTTASTGSTNTDGRATSPWPTYVNPWQGHIAMYPAPIPLGQQCQHAYMAASVTYTSPRFLPGQPQQQLLYQQAAPVPSPGWTSWNGTGWDQQLLVNSFSTMALQLPPTSIQDWVADSGASHHTTPSAGNISKTRLLNSSSPSSIIVGNGSYLPITSVDGSVLPKPFYLNNILLAPDIGQNLLSVRRFTTNNWCSIKFDSFGLSLKDLTTRNVIIRLNSVGPLYTMRLPGSTTPSSDTATALTTVAPTI
jgi:hypothetical protein